MILYVVRHGQTQYNIEKRFQGQIDVPLTEIGINQTKEVSKKLANTNLDIIISSPLSRALNTAKAIQENNPKAPIIINNNIIERGFGNFEGLTDISKYNCDINKLLDYNLNYSDYNVEPIQDLFKRINNFLFFCYHNYSNKTICLSTHGGVVQVIECLLKKMPLNTNLQELSLKNCEFRKYDNDCIINFIK